MTRRFLLGATAAMAQQRADSAFDPPVTSPRFPKGAGPLIGIDENHNNFHTAGGRYATFARILEKDGYVVSKAAESNHQLLVVANALHTRNAKDWRAETQPAFTPSEVEKIAASVADGGGLLLIADHQPFPAAAATLAAAFGVEFHNGYAFDPDRGRGPARFKKSDQSLRTHPLTEAIDQVMTFTGSAFRIRSGHPILVFGPNAFSYVSETPGRSGGRRLSQQPVAGWLQGAAIPHGKGRVYVSGEAAMFSAQRTGPYADPMGLNHPDAAGNIEFLRRIAAWLTRAT